MSTWRYSCFLAGLVVGTSVPASARLADPPNRGFDERQIQEWTLKGPLGAIPKRVTNTAPLSDQADRGHWVRFEPMTDEFEGRMLDTNKWVVGLEWWAGRQPAPFCDSNVTVSDGELHLTLRKEAVPAKLAARGYHDYTTAAVHSRARTAYGYFEVSAKPMNSAGSSAFWFQQDATPGWATEIDVFEIGGNAKGFERRDNMNAHVFRTPQEKRHWDRHGEWEAPGRLADDYHVYGLEWDPAMIRYYFDGVLVRTVQNTHWHQPLYLIFDSETMGGWFGLPADADLPSTFSIQYVRAWKKGR